MKKTKRSLRRFLALALTALMLIPCAAGAIPLSATDTEGEFELKELATVLVEGGTFKTIQAGQDIFADRVGVHYFKDTVPEYLTGKQFLFQNISANVTATVKTSGYVYIVSQTGSAVADSLPDKGFTKVQDIAARTLGPQLKAVSEVYAKAVTPGETISYSGMWGFLIADFIASENEMFEKPLAQIKSAQNYEILTAVVGANLFVYRDSGNHFIANTAPEWFLGKTYVQTNINDRTPTFTVVRDGWLYVLAEEGTSVNATLTDTYGFSKISTIAGDGKTTGTLAPNLKKNIHVYAKNVKANDQFIFGKWVIVLGAEPTVEEPTDKGAIDLYLIAGQSNAAGQTKINDKDAAYALASELQYGFSNVLYAGKASLTGATDCNWVPSKLGMGIGTEEKYLGQKREWQLLFPSTITRKPERLRVFSNTHTAEAQ